MSSELERYFVQGSAPAAATLMAPAAPRAQHPEVCHPDGGFGHTVQCTAYTSQPLQVNHSQSCHWPVIMLAALEQHGISAQLKLALSSLAPDIGFRGSYHSMRDGVGLHW